MLTAALVLAAGIASPATVSTATPRVPPAQPPTIQLSAKEMIGLAEFALETGDADAASTIYRALEEDPDPQIRAEARFRHAKQLMAANRAADAAALLRRLLDEQPDATGVRLELAGLLHDMGEDDAALRQLRAAQAAGLPPEVARMVDRYSEALRASRAFGASFQIALAPDSNVNKATRSETLGTIFGDFEIDGDSKAKSGVGLSLSGQAYRRLDLGKGNHRLLARLSGAADLYRHARFNDIAVDLAVGPELQLGKNRLNIEAALTERWYGMDPYLRSGRLSVSLTRPLGSTTQLQLIGSAGIADYRLNDLQDGRTFFGRIKLEHALSATTGIGLNLSAGRTTAMDPAYSTREWRLGFIGWRDVGRATLTLEAEHGRLHADDRLALLPERRSDRYSRLTFGATFRQLGFGGFAPVTRVVIERNRSTVEFYEYSRRRTEFGIVRAF